LPVFVTPTTIDGTIENVNPITAQAALDLTAARSTSKYLQHQSLIILRFMGME
jgi:hypothetical protein